MNKRIYFIIASVAMVIFAIMTYQMSKDQSRDMVDNDTMFLPGFYDKISAIDKIVVKNIANHTTLYKSAKDGNFWQVIELNDFFADERRIAKILYDFSQMQKKDKKTKDVAKYHHLGVQDISTKGSESTQYSFYIGDKLYEKVLIGNTKTAANNNVLYARKAKQGDEELQAQSWLIAGQLAKTGNKFEYQKKQFKIFDEQNIDRFTLTKGNISFDKNDSGEWVSSIDDADTSIINNFVKQWAMVTMLDKIAIDAPSKQTNKPFVTFTTINGQVIKVYVVLHDKINFMRIEGSNQAISEQLFTKYWIRTNNLDELLQTKWSGK